LEMTDSFLPFKPHRLFPGGVAQTILGAKFPGETLLPPRKVHKIQIAPRSKLMAFELESGNLRSAVVLMAHGMGGCSESGYMRRIAWKLWKRGAGVFMMNHRGSGPGMGLSDRLWNGGSSDDLDQVVRYIVKKYPNRSLLIVGFSLSGNILLKYLGEGRILPGNVHGAFSVNPPIDLKISSQILSEKNGGGIFNRYYMNLIQRQCNALAECHPHALQPDRPFRTIWDFDVVYTAPAAGFRDVEEYYSKCSASQFIGSIQVPTTILSARDDPFVPPAVFENIQMKLPVNYLAPDRGGHMGYLTGKPTPLGDHRWMDYVIVNWVENKSIT